MKVPFFILFFAITSGLTAHEADPPIELGQVEWLRDFDLGIVKAQETDRPIFLLFQEVPGCGTCQRYGQEVLSHPLIVEAIETLFIPVAIYNNKGGKDKKVLQYYGEPSWNNPVVRIVNGQKQDLIPRVNGNYTPQAIVAGMVQALTAARQPIPQYLNLLNQELSGAARSETAYLSMYCFWTGEKEIAQIDGVLATRPGFMHSREVVEVKYDPQRINLESLTNHADQVQCANQVYVDQSTTKVGQQQQKKIRSTGKFRLDHDPKYYLSKTVYQYLPMTALQAAKANSLIGQGQQPDEVLSPRQLALLQLIRRHPTAAWPPLIEVSLRGAWAKIEHVKSSLSRS